MGSTGGLGAVGPEVRILSSPPVIAVVIQTRPKDAEKWATRTLHHSVPLVHR